jgi:hypothetical protein
MVSALHSISPDKLNSMTKYPSIPTYHTLQPNGGLIEPAIQFTGPVVATEKIDGLNARIIYLPDYSYVLGSREELLYARGDYLASSVHGLVETLRPFAETKWNDVNLFPDSILVFYVELFGGRNLTPGSKDYTGQNGVAFRLFDIGIIGNYKDLAERSIEEIASWRDNGGQTFGTEHSLNLFSDESGVPLTPRLLTLDDANELPRTVEATHDWLAEHATTTRAAIDTGARGRAEGIVLRSIDRSAIAKLRFQNYNRTRQLRGKEAAASRWQSTWGR